VVDFRSGWALLSLPLCFRTDKTFAADASLSRRASWGRPMSRFCCCCCRYTFAQVKHLLSLRFRIDITFAAAALALRFRTENIRFAAGSRANRCFLRESEVAAAPMLVTKALSQDVMVLAFVPLSLIPKESPSLHSNQLVCMTF